MFRVCHASLSVQCSLVVTCWERANFLFGSLMCGVMLCFVTFPCGVMGWVWYLIVSIPDFCLLTYLDVAVKKSKPFSYKPKNIIN